MRRKAHPLRGGVQQRGIGAEGNVGQLPVRLVERERQADHDLVQAIPQLQVHAAGDGGGCIHLGGLRRVEALIHGVEDVHVHQRRRTPLHLGVGVLQREARQVVVQNQPGA